VEYTKPITFVAAYKKQQNLRKENSYQQVLQWRTLSNALSSHATRLLGLCDSCPILFDRVYNTITIQYNTIQILLSTPHGGFSETITNIEIEFNRKSMKIEDRDPLIETCEAL